MVHTTKWFNLITIYANWKCNSSESETFFISIFNYEKYSLYICQAFAAGRWMTIIYVTHDTKIKFDNRTVDQQRPYPTTAFSRMPRIAQDYHRQPDGLSYLKAQKCEASSQRLQTTAKAKTVCMARSLPTGLTRLVVRVDTKLEKQYSIPDGMTYRTSAKS